jgi:uncharacterized damage-inducible protein DinB
MKAFFRELLVYSHHYNHQLIEIFTAHPGGIPEKALKLFSHVLNAQQIWNNRIEPGDISPGVWDIRQTEEFANINTANLEKSLALLDKFDFDKTIAYTTSQGQPFSNTVRDILFHVINHSTYHRAQIASELKQHGITPPITDYIFYKR